MTTNDIDAIRKLAAAATEGPWFYNSYSAVLAGPKVQPHEEWLDTTGEHSLERHGNCEACGPDRRGCLLFSEDYKRDPIVAHVPAHHGDTAVGERVADAEFIAAARTVVPALCDEIEQLRDSFKCAHEDRLARALERDRTTAVDQAELGADWPEPVRPGDPG
ncbi:hypothetical protein [Micromonospora sp. CB01531]|uniref:hypothetical protein n=1 Tax=Micromonospora sp. CB01531 TaxID=1718947 RepID=UPI0009391BF2|nr:hypothetical protein [Micromonospora sp. CB01531]OKI47273.1 hypothetical protein A6A27_10525 [Micromonospora sp. CB01531]